MKALWVKMMEKERTLLHSHQNEIHRKIRSKHNIYLAYNRIRKETMLIIELCLKDEKKKYLPTCQGFSCNLGTINSSPALILSCSEKQNIDFFLNVIDDVIKYVEPIDTSELINATLKRLEKWQFFFKKHGIHSMSTEAQEGLYGELKVLESLSNHARLPYLIHAWVGPFKEKHDYCFDIFNIEAKCTTKKNPPSIRIHGLSQLKVPKRKSLFLSVLNVSLSKNEGETLNDIVMRISGKLGNIPDVLEQFQSKLIENGFPISGLEEPVCFNINEKGHRWYRVTDDFPKVYGDDSVFGCEYSLPLVSFEPFSCDKTEIIKILLMNSEAS